MCVSRRLLIYNGAILYNTLNSKIQECDSVTSYMNIYVSGGRYE